MVWEIGSGSDMPDPYNPEGHAAPRHVGTVPLHPASIKQLDDLSGEWKKMVAFTAADEPGPPKDLLVVGHEKLAQTPAGISQYRVEGFNICGSPLS